MTTRCRRRARPAPSRRRCCLIALVVAVECLTVACAAGRAGSGRSRIAGPC